MKNHNFIDIIMEWHIMRPFRPIYDTYREGLLYLVFGGITFFLSIASYALLVHLFGINILIANVVSWIIGVTFSYFATKKCVFEDRRWEFSYVIRQMVEFYMARIATLLFQEVLLFVFVKNMGCTGDVTKIITEVINIILNYIVSKFWIFSKRNTHE